MSLAKDASSRARREEIRQKKVDIDKKLVAEGKPDLRLAVGPTGGRDNPSTLPAWPKHPWGSAGIGIARSSNKGGKPDTSYTRKEKDLEFANLSRDRGLFRSELGARRAGIKSSILAQRKITPKLPMDKINSIAKEAGEATNRAYNLFTRSVDKARTIPGYDLAKKRALAAGNEAIKEDAITGMVANLFGGTKPRTRQIKRTGKETLAEAPRFKNPVITLTHNVRHGEVPAGVLSGRKTIQGVEDGHYPTRHHFIPTSGHPKYVGKIITELHPAHVEGTPTFSPDSHPRKPSKSSAAVRKSDKLQAIDRFVQPKVYGFREKAAGDRKHRVPKAVEHRAKAIMRKGHEPSAAYAIAVAQSQKEGRIKPGTMKLTGKGRGWEAKHKREKQ